MEQRICGTNTHEEADVIIVKYMMQFYKAHALSGCDTTGRYYGIANETVVKQLKKACNCCSFGTLKVIWQILYKSAWRLLIHAMVLQTQIWKHGKHENMD